MAPTQNKKVKQTMALFVVTFLISLIVITYFIKSFSPNVDVEIGGEGEDRQTVEDSSESDVKQAIDDRLKWIQMEDNMPGASKREDGKSTDEVNYESTSGKDLQDIAEEVSERGSKAQKAKELQSIDYAGPQHKSNVAPPPVPTQPAAEPFKMSKVYVGSYPTIEQAIQAQNKLMNTSSSVSPFVKEVNGSYVLQAGSYASPGKAEAVSREINSLGFHARVVKE